MLHRLTSISMSGATNLLIIGRITCSLTIIITFYTLLFPSFTIAQVSDSSSSNNEELRRIFEEDQSDRLPKDGKAIDWKIVGPRDREREAYVKGLYNSNQLRTGSDYFYAAMILQHGKSPEDYLLAHELCIVAICKGENRAKWLCAAAEDRFLMSIGRPQRFATQFKSDGPGKPMYLYNLDESVTDEFRKELNVPPLSQARKQEEAMNK